MIYEHITPTNVMSGNSVDLKATITAPGSVTIDRVILLEAGEDLSSVADSFQTDYLSSMVAQLAEENEKLRAQVEEHADLARIVIAQAEKIRNLEARSESPTPRASNSRRRRRR